MLEEFHQAIEEEELRQERIKQLRQSSSAYGAQTDDLLTQLAQHLRSQSFNTWFSDAFIVAADETSISLCAKDHHTANWIEEHYLSLLRKITSKDKVEIIPSITPTPSQCGSYSSVG